MTRCSYLSQRVELFSHAGQLEMVEMALYPAIGQVGHVATSAQASYWCRGRISTRGAWNGPQSEPGGPSVPCRYSPAAGSPDTASGH